MIKPACSKVADEVKINGVSVKPDATVKAPGIPVSNFKAIY